MMSHSPMRMFHQFHDKRVLVSGQGPVVDIARNVGFHNVVTIEELRNTFPALDAVDHSRQLPANVSCKLSSTRYFDIFITNTFKN